MLHVAWSVCLCWSHGCVVEKRMCRWRCRAGTDSCVWPKEPCIRKSRSPWEGEMLGLFGPRKNTGSTAVVYATKWIIQSLVTAWQRDCCSRLQCSWLVGVTLLSREKSAPCDAAFCQNSLTTCPVFVAPCCMCNRNICLRCLWSFVRWAMIWLNDDQ